MSDSPRREFFRQAFGRVLRPVANYIEKKLPDSRLHTRIRPPGAIGEDLFSTTCLRCGNCANVCPAKCILFVEGEGPDAGTPYIDPNISPCVVCDGLHCTHVCPSGALRPVEDALFINMGVAEVFSQQCVRTSGQTCTMCVDRCPIPAAIHFPDAGPPEVLSTCVGCGVCQFYCPTTPKAVVVRPS